MNSLTNEGLQKLIILLLTTAKAKLLEIKLQRLILKCEQANIKVTEGYFQVGIKRHNAENKH